MKKEGGALPRDTAERISHLLAIWKALQILFTDPQRSDGWLRRSNAFFDGVSALDVMLEGNFYDIVRVRPSLDAQRGGCHAGRRGRRTVPQSHTFPLPPFSSLSAPQCRAK